MNTEETKSTLQEKCTQSDMLSRKAWDELLLNGDTDVVCPFCSEKPVLTKSRNRISIACRCRNLRYMEIFF